MNFTENYYLLKSQLYSPEKKIISPSGTRVVWMNFKSCRTGISQESEFLGEMRKSIPSASRDEEITENREFTYPLFIPAGVDVNKGCIFLLHGLNERKWDKYLSWADYLATKTGKSVILFPISFHVNRSLPEWTDRRLMTARAEERKKRYRLEDSETTFINEALSERLTESPERFFLSGLQTADDLLSLLNEIYQGDHPYFSRNTQSDIFAYSIGGLLAQVLFLANPDELLTNSKLFLFCAGSFFKDMNGISKLIMDPMAYHKIYGYYLHNLEKEVKKSGVFAEFFNKNKIGMAFRSMIAPDRFSNFRESIFQKKKEQIYAISLKNDRVIPTPGIRDALLGSPNRIPSNMEVTDFSFPHRHEMPFPVNPESIRKLVDEAFESVFSKAAVFLS
jgi:hypothetical protein